MSENAEHYREKYRAVRNATERLCKPLLVEDYVVQSMPDVSPPKWHLGHTTWFFETLVLGARAARRGESPKPYHPGYGYLFNSYYESLGKRVERSRRGLQSRPSVEEIYRYRSWVDEQVLSGGFEGIEGALILGIQHEQQHQELLMMDIKHIFHENALKPAYREAPEFSGVALADPEQERWIAFEGGLREIGHRGAGFAFDNERPRHPVYVESFEIRAEAVTNGEFAEFIEAGGYERPEYWLSDGWSKVRELGWAAPLYWSREGKGGSDGGGWRIFTLAGEVALDPGWPVSHLSYYEADAFARWKGARLPTEAEWEVSASASAIRYGQVWEWTQSAYLPYPGFHPFEGSASEYNGKFMSNQMVLRGSSAVTPVDHVAGRHTYRNFFAPEMRWQYSGFRLARNRRR